MKKGKDKKKRKEKKDKGRGLGGKMSPKQLKKQVKALQRQVDLRDEIIRDLNSRLLHERASSIEAGPIAEPLSEPKKRGVALAHRKAWERHQYLRSRYEHHLESGAERGQARALADSDLRGRYGEDAGFSEEQLDAILT